MHSRDLNDLAWIWCRRQEVFWKMREEIIQNMPGLPFHLAEILKQDKYTKESFIVKTFFCKYSQMKRHGSTRKSSSLARKAMASSLLLPWFWRINQKSTGSSNTRSEHELQDRWKISHGERTWWQSSSWTNTQDILHYSGTSKDENGTQFKMGEMKILV